MMKKPIWSAICFAVLITSKAEEEPVLSYLVDRASEIVILKVERAENGSVISEQSTRFFIVGTIEETLKGNLRPEDKVTIKISNPLRNRDMNPVSVKPGETYVVFLNPARYVDSIKISHYTIQDPPFGITPSTKTLLSNMKREIAIKTNHAKD